MKKLLLVSLLFLAGCGANPLSFFTGGGPNVAANVQAGEQNTQTLGQSNTRQVEQSVKQAGEVRQSADENQVRADQVETVVVQQPLNPFWVMVLILWSIFLWQLPSPDEIWRKLGRFRD